MIDPEGGRGADANMPGTGGDFGFLDSTWQDIMVPYLEGIYPGQVIPEYPYEASLDMQATAALHLYAMNGGFGPSAWNNQAACGKGG